MGIEPTWAAAATILAFGVARAEGTEPGSAAGKTPESAEGTEPVSADGTPFLEASAAGSFGFVAEAAGLAPGIFDGLSATEGALEFGLVAGLADRVAGLLRWLAFVGDLATVPAGGWFAGLEPGWAEGGLAVVFGPACDAGFFAAVFGGTWGGRLGAGGRAGWGIEALGGW